MLKILEVNLNCAVPLADVLLVFSLGRPI